MSLPSRHDFHDLNVTSSKVFKLHLTLYCIVLPRTVLGIIQPGCASVRVWVGVEVLWSFCGRADYKKE